MNKQLEAVARAICEGRASPCGRVDIGGGDNCILCIKQAKAAIQALIDMDWDQKSLRDIPFKEKQEQVTYMVEQEAKSMLQQMKQGE